MSSFNLENETVRFHQQLVSIPSFSGLEEQVARAVETKMCTLDFDQVWCDDFGNVIGKRTSQSEGAAIVYDAHMDVVQVDDLEKWSHPPFSGALDGKAIWGRGSADTKSSLAGLVMGLGTLPRKDFSGTLYVVASVGEEIIEGVALAKVIDLLQPQGVVVGEPTDCRLGIGHKGRARCKFTVFGRPAHTATPQEGDNAVLKIPALIDRIQHVPVPSDPWIGQGIMEPVEMISSPYPSASTVPAACSITYDRRLILGETENSLMTTYAQALADLPDWKMELEQVSYTTYTGHTFQTPDFHPAWRMEPDSAWVSLGKHGLARGGLRPDVYTTPYCTNGSYSAGVANIPTLVFGPGNIRRAHSIDEHIEVQELLRGLKGFIGLAQVLGSFV
jgi:putative selenium metabolism hydrolase